MGKRDHTDLTADKITPGPGQYTDVRDKYYKNIPGSKIGKDNRKPNFLNTPYYAKPSPGQYRTFSFVEKTDAPKYGFGSSYREKKYSDGHMTLPGPSTYN